VGRLVTGFGAGASSAVVPVYLNEISPARMRGAIGVVHQISFTTGIFIAQIAGLLLSEPPYWRVVLAIPCVFCLIQLAILPFGVQSPKV